MRLHDTGVCVVRSISGAGEATVGFGMPFWNRATGRPSLIPSGLNHDDRLDHAAAVAGKEGMHDAVGAEVPDASLPDGLPTLHPTAISVTDVSRLFTGVPFGAHASLLPESIRAAGS